MLYVAKLRAGMLPVMFKILTSKGVCVGYPGGFLDHAQPAQFLKKDLMNVRRYLNDHAYWDIDSFTIFCSCYSSAQ
jgi:hypothetical protein